VDVKRDDARQVPVKLESTQIKEICNFVHHQKSFFNLVIFLIFIVSMGRIQVRRSEPFEIVGISALHRWYLQGGASCGGNYLSDEVKIDSSATVASFLRNVVSCALNTKSPNPNDKMVTDDFVVLAMTLRLFNLERRRTCGNIGTPYYTHGERLENYTCSSSQMPGHSWQSEKEESFGILESEGIPKEFVNREPTTLFLNGKTPYILLYHKGEYSKSINSTIVNKIMDSAGKIIERYDPVIALDTLLYSPSKKVILNYDIYFEKVQSSVRRYYHFNTFYRARVYNDGEADWFFYWVLHAINYICGIYIISLQVKRVRNTYLFCHNDNMRKSWGKSESFPENTQRPYNRCKETVRIFLQYSEGPFNKTEMIGNLFFILWIVLDVIHLVSYMHTWTIKYPSDLSTKEDARNYSTEVWMKLLQGTSWSAISLYVAAVHFVLMGIRIFKYFEFLGGMRVLNDTIYFTAGFIGNVLVLFTCTIGILAVVCKVWLGEYGGHIDFQSFEHSLNHVVLMSWGLYDYSRFTYGEFGDESDHANIGQTGTGAREFKQILFWTNLFLTTVFFQNIFLAGISKGYDQALEKYEMEGKEANNVKSMVNESFEWARRYLRNLMKLLFFQCSCQKLDFENETESDAMMIWYLTCKGSVYICDLFTNPISDKVFDRPEVKKIMESYNGDIASAVKDHFNIALSDTEVQSLLQVWPKARKRRQTFHTILTTQMVGALRKKLKGSEDKEVRLSKIEQKISSIEYQIRLLLQHFKIPENRHDKEQSAQSL
jgi:hypothetical protein